MNVRTTGTVKDDGADGTHLAEGQGTVGGGERADGQDAVDRMLRLFRGVCQIRAFEQCASDLYRQRHIPGFVHTSLGQEASAVGACASLRPTDTITSTHRGHGHCLAKGLTPVSMFAELFGRSTGVASGLGGSMHIADPQLGILGANGIVGAGLPIAVGAAWAAQDRGDVVVAFFGDGAVGQGMFHEAVNLASLWALPVIFLCENNGFAEFTADDVGHPVSLADRARGYGVPYVAVDGTDVWAVDECVRSTVDGVRGGAGPVMIEAHSRRWHGHYEGDQQPYRARDERADARQQDPIRVARDRLLAMGVAPARIDGTEREAFDEIARAADEALHDPPPPSGHWRSVVTAPRSHVSELPTLTDEITYINGIRSALADALADDEAVRFAGIDVAGGGGVFGVSRGLAEQWPDRVRDTPISESAIVGLAVGGAMAGLKPIVEIMYLDFIGVAFDGLLNQASKLHFMTGGRARVGLTIRTQFGAGRSAGGQHSQSLEALLAHVPGLAVVMPSTPADAYGLLRSAIDDPNPVVFIENRLLYSTTSAAPTPGHRVPIGQAAVRRSGSDVTVVTYSRMAVECLAVAEELALEGIDVEVVDLRTISPWDTETVLRSVEKTSKLVVVHEAVTPFGVGAEITATLASEAYWLLDAPIQRVGAAFSPAPYAPQLEQEWLPSRDDIATSIRTLAAF